MHPLMPELERELHQWGLHGALVYLNRRVPHRFTNIFRLSLGTFVPIGLVDKQSLLTLQSQKPVDFQYSMCRFSLDTGFESADVTHDERIQGHLPTDGIGSYIGLPLRISSDELYGTVCHYDPQPQQVSEQELDFFKVAAVRLAHYLATHQYQRWDGS